MSVKLLLIEDDLSFLEDARAALLELGPDVEVRIARSRDAAAAALSEECFDLAILDLKLPTADGILDADAEHGRAVLQKARLLAPGMPLVILTGSPAEAFIGDFLQNSERVDVWGDGKKRSTIDFLRKSSLDELPDLVEPAIRAVRAVKDVELTRGGPAFNLTWCQDRLIRIFVRRWGGASCAVCRISGGLSGAEVFRVAVRDAVGAPILTAILKVAPPGVVEAEAENYSRHAQRLPEAATARLIGDVRFGGGPRAAVSYRLAESYGESLFVAAAHSPERAATAVREAAKLLEPWRRGIQQRRATIADVRRRLLCDQKAHGIAKAFGLGWAGALEGRSVQVKWCCIHGDLHGGNLLVDRDGTPILIDYGDVGEGPASLDWVALELSALFHPDGCARLGEWPNQGQCGAWPDSEAFVGASPLAPFLAACRATAHEAGAGPREVAASAYAYLLRQLGYDDTDKARALALLESVRRFIDTAT